MPYTRTTEHGMAVCSGRDGAETALHAVRFPESCNWSYISPNMGRTPDWAAEAVFIHLEGCEVGTEFGYDDLNSVLFATSGLIYDYTEGGSRQMCDAELHAKLEDFIGTEVVNTLE